MKIEKLTENKIRIILKIEEMNNNNINLHDFMIDNIKSKNFFIDILDKAEKEFGFKTKGYKLLIEAFSSLDDVFVFTITKYLENQNNKKILKAVKKEKKYLLNFPIYSFNNFEDFCVLCEFLSNTNFPLTNIAKNISLYLYNNTYYLVFIKPNLSYPYLKTLLAIISEFSNGNIKKNNNFNSILLEHGKLIMNKNAFLTGIKYFSW